jgi:enamine deaminase RidA (YjgF/YER057c/UK114 family)
MTRRIGVAVLILAFCVAAGAADRKHIVKPRASDMNALPFSDAVLVGNTLYIAGHIGLDPKTGTPPASPEDEARLVMDGIKQTVEQAGLAMDDIVSVQVFCIDLSSTIRSTRCTRHTSTAIIRRERLLVPTNCCEAADMKFLGSP